MTPKAGQIIDGRYGLTRQLGEGGFGAVWLAEETAVGRQVAIKFLKRDLDRDELVRFQREVQALGRLAHDHILTLYNVGEQDGSRYIVTEFVSGQTLADWRPRSTEDIITVATQIAAALAAAHREGIIHRDLKPANVMVARDHHDNPRVKILDFGIAKLSGSEQRDITKTGEVLGTPGFMSPEQLKGISDIGPATDLYNLGVLLWEMLERRPMFTADTALGVCMQHLLEAPPPLTQSMSVELERLVFRLLDKNPARRGSAQAAYLALTTRAPAAMAPATANLSGPRWIIALFAILGGFGLAVLFSVSGRDDVARPVPASDDARVGSLVNSPDNKPGPVMAPPDAGPPMIDQGHECGEDWQSGVLRAREIGRVPGAIAHSLIVVPQGYDPGRANALVLVLHDGRQSPESIRRASSRLVEIAHQKGVVIVFAAGQLRTRDRIATSLGSSEPGEIRTSSFPWPPEHVATLETLLDTLMTAFCVDPERLFLIGHGRGGRGAERLLQISDTFRAVAMTDHRRKVEDEFLLSERTPIPSLWLTSKDNPHFPDNGKLNNCLDKDELVVFDAQERQLRSHYQCTGHSLDFPTSEGASCRTWDCATTFVSCRVDGDGLRTAIEEPRGECVVSRSSYDRDREIWNFFERVSRDP